ncbi:hypothetical protein NHX12_001912, partial [Muraenolepis orangiensis]
MSDRSSSVGGLLGLWTQSPGTLDPVSRDSGPSLLGLWTQSPGTLDPIPTVGGDQKHMRFVMLCSPPAGGPIWRNPDAKPRPLYTTGREMESPGGLSKQLHRRMGPPSSLWELQGVLVTLSSEGHLQCSYLGTDPSFFSTPKVDAREVDYEQVDAEMKTLQRFIREATRTQDILPKADTEDALT